MENLIGKIQNRIDELSTTVESRATNRREITTLEILRNMAATKSLENYVEYLNGNINGDGGKALQEFSKVVLSWMK